MEKAIYFEDYELNASRISQGRTITETDIVIHAGQTGDFFPHHMDKEWCAASEFKERIAHGTLIFSVAVGMTANLINPVAFSYGYDKIRFIKPVHINDTITVETVITEKKDHPKYSDRGFVIETLKVTNQRNELVLICSHVLLCDKKL